MGLVYLPTFAIKINQTYVGKYTSPMDAMGTLPETNSSHLKIDYPQRKVVFQSSNHPFSGATVDGRNPAPPGMVKTL